MTTKGHLSNYFRQIAYKRLTPTEADPTTSRGHEFQGIATLRNMFGADYEEIDAHFLHLSEVHENVTIYETGGLTWYDSRRNKPKRSSEYRLYYHSTLVEDYYKPGDLLVIAKTPNGQIVVISTPEGSTYERQLVWLFALDADEAFKEFRIKDIEKSEDKALELASKLILENIGVEVIEDAPDLLGPMLKKFPNGFPTTREFSAYARQTLAETDVASDSDGVLMRWMNREDLLFRTLERHIVEKHLEKGFGNDVDRFISFSLSVHNRRKSRAGYALENHLEQVFKSHKIRYDRGQATENKSKPDFVFPGIVEYRNQEFEESLLTVLGVKTTCKDRWRQVLAEANRIKNKHLITLEPGISENQTNAMQFTRVQLVMPQELHKTYTITQQKWLMNVGDLIELVRERQRGGRAI